MILHVILNNAVVRAFFPDKVATDWMQSHVPEYFSPKKRVADVYAGKIHRISRGGDAWVSFMHAEEYRWRPIEYTRTCNHVPDRAQFLDVSFTSQITSITRVRQEDVVIKA